MHVARTLIAFLVAVAGALLPISAAGQTQPVPVYQAKSDTVTLFTTPGSTSEKSVVIDARGFASVLVQVANTGTCAESDNGPFIHLLTGVSSGSVVASVLDQNTHMITNVTVNVGYLLDDSHKISIYEVAPLPNFIQFHWDGTGEGVNCDDTSVFAVLMPFSTVQSVKGEYPANITFNHGISPVLMGGVSDVSGGRQPHVATVDADGALLVNMIGSPDGGAVYVQEIGRLVTSPDVPSTVSLSANVSGSICSLTAGNYYRISCNVDASYRTGAATPTAVSTDNDLRAGMVETVKLHTGHTCFAFISSSAGVCKAAERDSE